MRRAVRAIVLRNDALLVMHRNKFGQSYYTLVGGGIRSGESPEQAVLREVHEESSISVGSPRLVFVEAGGEPFGPQYIYLCEYQSGEAALPPQSEEAKIHALGSNLYTPAWLPVVQLPGVALVTTPLKAAIIHSLQHGFPDHPVEIRPK